ncbi:RsmD family RNA methyltransferase [bacterium]|nr:RsmD family RNA methyltransferase [bacterium]
MRITSGELKGREIRLAKNSRARPATGFVRELVMNLFTPDRLRAGAFLDICAGSGIVGLEAVSRGAPLLFSVEVDRRTCDDLRSQTREFGIEERVRVLKVDGRRCTGVVAKQLPEGMKVSCCFLDPPYIQDMARSLLPGLVLSPDIWSADALIIMRTPDTLPESNAGLELLERRKAGNASLWVFRPTTGSDS